MKTIYATLIVIACALLGCASEPSTRDGIGVKESDTPSSDRAWDTDSSGTDDSPFETDRDTFPDSDSEPESFDTATENCVWEAITIQVSDDAPCLLSFDWRTIPITDPHRYCPYIDVIAVIDGGVDEYRLRYSGDCSQVSAWRFYDLVDVDYATPIDSYQTIEICPEECRNIASEGEAHVIVAFGCQWGP